MFRLDLFGGLTLSDREGPLAGPAAQQRRLAVLALLAASPAGSVSRERLAALLWPEKDARRARHRLADTLHGLRSALGRDAIQVIGDDLRLDPNVVSSDVADFEAALGRKELERAVSLYRGPFLDGFFVRGSVDFEGWADAARMRYARETGAALRELAAAAAERDDHSAAARWWHELAALEPLNGTAVLGLMEALAASGDRAGALVRGRAHAELLREELDLDADPAVMALAERLKGRAGDPPPRQTGASLGCARERDGDTPVSLAVLPFANLGPAEDDTYLAEGVAEEVIHALGRMPGLRVTARTSSFALGRRTDVREVGRLLGVDAVLEGSVRRESGRLRIVIRLVDTIHAGQLWSERYDREGGDVLELQEEIARSVADALRPRLPSVAGWTRARRPPVDAEAHDRYLQGRYFLAMRTREGMLRAVDCFERAVAHDPGYGRAHAGLAESYLMLGSGNHGVLAPRDAMDRARRSAERALACDDQLAEAEVSLGIAAMHAWRWDEARSRLLRALELDPGSAAAHHRLGWLRAITGDPQGGLAEVRRARDLDPLSLPIHNAIGRILEFLGRPDDAIRQYRRSLELDPMCADAYCGLGTAYMKMGLFGEAVAALERARDLACTPGLFALHGFALALAGRSDEARAVVDELLARSGPDDAPAAHVGDVCMALGDIDEGFLWYERAYEQRSPTLMYLRVDPMWPPMRADPRWEALVRRIGLGRGAVRRRAK